MTDTLTTPKGTITTSAKLTSLDSSKSWPKNVLKPFSHLYDTPEGLATVEFDAVYTPAPVVPSSPNPNLPPSVAVGALLWDGAANGWEAFSRQRATAWSMNGVVTDPRCVAIDSQSNVLSLSLLSINGTTYGGYAGTSTTDGGKGYMLPARCIWEFVAAVPLTAWCAGWAVGANWPNDGEEDVIEILGGKDTSNYHGTTDSTNSGAIGVQTAAKRSYTLVRDTDSCTVFWGGIAVRTYQTANGGAPQSLIFNVGQGTIGSRMDVTDCKVWALP